jgi:uncharacterized protein (TIGR02271 family)
MAMAMADKNINYTDTKLDDDDALTTGTATVHSSGTEPATTHDTTEGGIMGAVGGAIVGALAGGPIGAVIGAVAGGIASAGAVNVVDRHDHDYNRTVGTDTDDTIRPTGTITSSTEPIGAANPGAYASDTASTGYNSNLAQNTGTIGTDRETVIPIVEEELEVGKRQVQSGGAHIRTGVVETPVEQQVTLREEHVNVTRHAVNEPVTDGAAAFKEQSFDVTETDEVPVVTKQARVVEEVVIGKTATDRTETVHDTVRRTDVEVDDLSADNTARR